MPIHIQVKGGGESEAQLKKVANGYRAIGKAADSAAHSAHKVHAGVISHESARSARAIGSMGGQLGRTGGHLAHFAAMGPGMLVAGAAMAAIEVAKMADEKRAELAMRDVELFRELGRVTADVTSEMGKRAKSTFDNMDVYARASAIGKGGPEGQAVKDAMQLEEVKKKRDKADFATGLTLETGKERFEMSHPKMAGMLPTLEALRSKADDARVKLDTQSRSGAAVEEVVKFVTGGLYETNHDKFLEAIEGLNKAADSIQEASGKLAHEANRHSEATP